MRGVNLSFILGRMLQLETWTPVLTLGGASVGMTYSRQDGWVAKLGPVVVLFGRITLTAKGSSTGSVAVASLPYTNTTRGAAMLGQQQNFTGLTGALSFYSQLSATTMTMFQSSATGSTAVTDAAITNTTDFSFVAVLGII